MSTRKKTRKGSSSRRHDATTDEWKQFTSPDGHPYYYNAATKESRWELPGEETARVKHRRHKDTSLNEEQSLNEEEPLDEEPKKEKKKKRPESDVKVTRKPKNAMFQKLQASLEGRLNGPMMGMKGPPPMLQIRHDDQGLNEQEEPKTPSIEEQYEAETAGMSAAERLRFLRKKRQENMMAKKESVAGDDFMAEVANNMKKKGVTVKPKQEETNREKRLSWKEQEQAEEERKRLQMQEELETKEREAAKERELKAAKEREERREQERAEQVEIERKREQERKQRQERMKQKQEEQVKESTDDRGY
ncbi:hypothetical protein PHMEG_00032948 [Phytophthora megakarya]|uniref:WW domain-containing protein n=1 Tax=Phytophthora megakarya TaxID=4795 RepID=A0A225UTX3_9STRA|nr:hypothetical protein PHMEG_00032948 [Phytophthora megakarya]